MTELFYDMIYFWSYINDPENVIMLFAYNVCIFKFTSN